MQKAIYEMSLLELVMLMEETEDIKTRNRIIMEITYRQYVPFQDKTFEEMLVENGYRIQKEEKGNKK